MTAKLSRRMAADEIASALDAAGYSASVWSGGDNVRVYLKDAKRRPLGYISIDPDGTLTPSLSRQKGTVMASVPDLAIEPLVRQPARAAAPALAQDEDVRQMEESARRVAEAERVREDG